jgi:hypothetical protein
VRASGGSGLRRAPDRRSRRRPRRSLLLARLGLKDRILPLILRQLELAREAEVDRRRNAERRIELPSDT